VGPLAFASRLSCGERYAQSYRPTFPSPESFSEGGLPVPSGYIDDALGYLEILFVEPPFPSTTQSLTYRHLKSHNPPFRVRDFPFLRQEVQVPPKQPIVFPLWSTNPSLLD